MAVAVAAVVVAAVAPVAPVVVQFGSGSYLGAAAAAAARWHDGAF